MVAASVFLAASLAAVGSATPIQKRAGPVSIPLKGSTVKVASLPGIYGKVGNWHRALYGNRFAENEDVPLTSQIMDYVAEVQVGEGGKTYELLVDTGSSNTFVGADQKYKKTKSSHNTGMKVAVSYGSGKFSGREYTDTVTIGGVTVTKQGVAVASQAQGFHGVDGILGVGPAELTQSTLVGHEGTEIPTIVDTAKEQGVIDEAVLGVYFAPPSKDGDQNGQLTFGGVAQDLTTSEVSWTPITKSGSASHYWGVTMNTLNIGKETVAKSTSGIVDTGTTLVYLASDVFEKYIKSIPGAKADKQTGLISFPKASLEKVPALSFDFPGIEKPIVWDAYSQVIPASQAQMLGVPDNGQLYSWVTDMGAMSGSGLDFILGMKFLERYYSVYDTPNKRVGFAETKFSKAAHPDDA